MPLWGKTVPGKVHLPKLLLDTHAIRVTSGDILFNGESILETRA